MALAVTNPKGDIAVLDPADYGTVTITQSVSIVNDGVGVASITPDVDANAITVTTGASDVVNLRGLTLTGANAGFVGIAFNTGGALNIQNCVIRGFTSVGIGFVPQQSSTLTVLDTVVSNNGTPNSTLLDGILIQPQINNINSGTVAACLGRVQVSGNRGHGIDVDDSSQQSGSFTMTVADSVATDNNANGVSVATPRHNHADQYEVDQQQQGARRR